MSPDLPTNSLADPAATATGGEVAPGVAPPPPATDRYALGEEIARGGMGVVHRATDAVLGREVAVKVLADRYGPRSGAARRFADEARITGQLQHPGIPPVHDLGTLPDGRPFLAMKLIKGRTLADHLRERPDPSADRGRFVPIFEGVCQAVGYAHAHGVVHRDLKPHNVMVGTFGEVQVMDWGLAKLLGYRAAAAADPDAEAGTEIRTLRGPEEGYTEAGSVLGTPAFMPPEQAIGAVDEIDARSDVFGLGAVLCAVLTGRPPFVGNTPESTRKLAARGKLDECFERLDACGADPELVALCKRCLSPEKAARPADGGEVAAAVAALRQAADERARRAELDRVRAEGERAAADLRAAEHRRRARLRLALAAALGLLVATGGALGWWADRQAADRHRAETDREAAELRRERAEAQGQAAEARLRFDAEQRAAADRERLARATASASALLDQAEAALRADDPDRAAVALSAAAARLTDGAAAALADRLARLRKDLDVLRDLNDVYRFRWTPVDGGGRPPVDEVAGRFRAALLRYGADPLTVSPAEAAARIAASPVRERLVNALDRQLWLYTGGERVRTALRLADPDPLRDAARDMIARDGRKKAAAKWSADPRVIDQPSWFVALLGESVAVPVERRREMLRSALQWRPGDLVLLMTLGYTYPALQKEGAEERLRWFQAAVAVAPRNPAAHLSLALAMKYTGDLDGAEVSYREAIRLDPKYAVAHNNLGVVHSLRGDLGAAEACRREAFRLDPRSPYVLANLGHQLRLQGEAVESAARLAEAVRLDPRYRLAHYHLALTLLDLGEPDRAIASLEAYRKLDPKGAAAASLTVARRMRALLPRLPGVVAGTDRPATPAEALDFADLLRRPFQKRYAAAARWYAEAFAARPSGSVKTLADAACAAARAGRGDGADAPADPAERAALRARALVWLRTALAAQQKRPVAPADTDRVASDWDLGYWQWVPDLAGVRPGVGRLGMPAVERAEWDALWADVRAARAAVRKPPPPPAVAPPPRPVTR